MIITAQEFTGDQFADADVCIIGSGASGAIIARDLSQAGYNVLVIEEGDYYSNEQMRRMKPSEAIRKLYRGYGSVATMGLGDTPAIPVLAGKAVGGSSMLTGGVIYRTPEEVVDHWHNDLGLTEITNKKLDAIFNELEKELPVKPTPAYMRSPSTLLFKKGADKLGYSMKTINRNSVDCQGCSQCSFYCPHGAKRSVDMQFIPQSRRAGARYYAGFRVDRIVKILGRADYAEAGFIGGDKRRHKLRVKAKLFVLAAGAMHSPHILLKSRIGNSSKMVGKNLSIHPSFRAYAQFDQEVNGWRGALQSMECNQFTNEGITLNAIFVPPAFTSVGFPDFGPENRRKMESMKHLAMFGAMVEDGPNGRIYSMGGSDPIITYRLPRKTIDEMVRASLILAEVFLAAGARKIFLSAHSLPTITSMDQVRKIWPSMVKGRDFESVAFHPLGSCRMGHDPRDSVVDQFGKSWDIPNLYITDGSMVPTAVRVNSQMTVMAMAKWVSRHILENRRKIFS